MTDCSSSIQESTSSSDVTSLHRRNPRIRVVRLTRPNSLNRRNTLLTVGTQNTSYGFSIRGGREYSIGFFVSRIERGSVADLKGLRVGDQLIRVNGYLVDDAVHKELSLYVSSQDRLVLKVRGVGMLPIKERPIDQLTWHIVPMKKHLAIHKVNEYNLFEDVRITLNVMPGTKLGLGICKGPEWKPGIFVQFTKESGIARDAGLRPGDQLISCNDVDFSDILFSEAVAVMKSSLCLEMIVRTAAGIDLFPGESSGYNSSASSVTGDQSPCWGDQSSKRLSIVKEEDSTERYGHISRAKHLQRTDLDRRKERIPVEPPIVPLNYKTKSKELQCNVPAYSFNNNKNENKSSNTTIIKLSSNGTVINNTLIPHHNKNNQTTVQVFSSNVDDSNVTVTDSHQLGKNYKNNVRVNMPTEYTGSNDDTTFGDKRECLTEGDETVADICFVSRKIETKTVKVEVHRCPPSSDETHVPPPPPPMMQQNDLHGSLSSSSLSIPSTCDGSSLSSAISEELKKRASRTNEEGISKKPTTTLSKQVRNALGGGVQGKDNEKYNALMDEFKQAHKKMFQKTTNAEEPVLSKENERQLEQSHAAINDSIQSNGYRSHPETPLPDYDVFPVVNNAAKSHHRNDNSSLKGTMGRCAAHEIAKANGNSAELASIDSFVLTNPSSPPPKPPQSYFTKSAPAPTSASSSSSSSSSSSAVALTIGEYSGRKPEPGKFNFLSATPAEKTTTNHGTPIEELKTELETTLLRSNLNKESNDMVEKKVTKTELNTTENVKSNNDNENTMQNRTKPTLVKTQSNVEKITAMLQSQNFMANGSNTNTNNNNNNNNSSSASTSTTTTVPQQQQQKSNNSRVTINIAQNNKNCTPNNGNCKTQLRKTESTPIVGILKNGGGGGISTTSINNNHLNTEQVKITFGNAN